MAVVIPGDHPDWQTPIARRKKAYPDGTGAGSIGANLPSFTATHHASTTKTFTLDANCTNLRVAMWDSAGGTNPGARVALVGHNTSIPFQPASLLVSSLIAGKPMDFRVSPELDAQVDLTVDLTTTSTVDDVKVYVSQLFGAETTYIAGIEDILVPTVKRPYQFQVEQSFTGSGTPLISVTGNSSQSVVVNSIAVTILAISAAAVTPKIQLVNTVGGIMEEWWMAASSTASVAAVDRLIISDVAYQDGILISTLKLQWDRAIGANTFTTLAFAGWLI